MLSVLGFLIILGPLVVAHEFGHYIFARIFGVKAEVFSIGFGPKIWSRQLGETELRVSWIPLGGFVKLLGEDREAPLSSEEQKRALHRQAPWKRFFIFFGGPLFNFLFAMIVFMAILAIGEPQISNVIGRVVKDSPAAHAGFVSGDKILSINGQPVRLYDDIMNIMAENPGKQLRFDVLHPSTAKPIELVATTNSEDGYSLYGEETRVGEVEGLLPSARAATVGISNPNSVAGKAGLQNGDTVVEFNGTTVKSFEDLESLYAAAPAKSAISLKIQKASHEASTKPETRNEVNLVLTKAASGSPESDSIEKAWGLHSSELFIEKVVPASPAAQAGIQPGDRVISVAGHPVESFFDLKDDVQKSGETSGKVEMEWERGGKTLSAQMTPTATVTRNMVSKKTTSYTVGIMPMLVMNEPDTVIEKVWNPFMLVYKGTERMIVFSWRNLVSIGKIAVGDVSVATLGGPIMIGKIAGESLQRGLVAFLNMMAILSIGLGVLNILPIPVLDGGHLLLLGIETIRGKPLALRTMEIIQSVGLSAILLLMVLVMKNDLYRLIP
jgi:regulator of sigma E protease